MPKDRFARERRRKAKEKSIKNRPSFQCPVCGGKNLFVRRATDRNLVSLTCDCGLRLDCIERVNYSEADYFSYASDLIYQEEPLDPAKLTFLFPESIRSLGRVRRQARQKQKLLILVEPGYYKQAEILLRRREISYSIAESDKRLCLRCRYHYPSSYGKCPRCGSSSYELQHQKHHFTIHATVGAGSQVVKELQEEGVQCQFGGLKHPFKARSPIQP